ncbi:hypothetical protein C5O69_11720 [Streptococcus pseudopneumoniae]|uniref:Minor tail protein gp31 C-terminal domain-containing protein n=1 Tax=Streptococcus pseudopneumoniae TaxID=257758 RepID=A0A3A4N1R0_9STRE|nr:hypothetical protein [Streptococcus pseudopneumoniae]RJP07674.1 hypothetical protein C5O69_11720 [Streptococcus pseudopneumoniae]
MSNLENLARAIGEDVKAIKEDSELKDREVQERLGSLESRPRVNPETLVTKAELEEKGYLTSHQDLSTYAQKWELYNDIPIKARISALENRPTGETIVNQQNRISMRYWAGTQAQYDAIRIKDSNTIYDIFK